MRFTKAIAVRFTKAVIAATLTLAFLTITPVKAFARDHDDDHRGDGYSRHGYYDREDRDDQGEDGDRGYYNQNNQGYYNRDGGGYYGRDEDGRREYYEHMRHERWEHERRERGHAYGYYPAPAPYIYFGIR